MRKLRSERLPPFISGPKQESGALIPNGPSIPIAEGIFFIAADRRAAGQRLGFPIGHHPQARKAGLRRGRGRSAGGVQRGLADDFLFPVGQNPNLRPNVRLGQ